MKSQWNHKIFDITDAGFEALALEIFAFQYQHNPVYRAYAEALEVKVEAVGNLGAIPFLPIRFFKTHPVISGAGEPALVFESSGTTGMVNSRHLVQDPGLYSDSFSRGFELFYGDIKNYCVIGLLPSYLERSNSSLVYMVKELVQQSQHPDSGFYLDEHEQLSSLLQRLEAQGQKTLLIGVTFALLDFAAKYPMPLRHTIIMETGGMKGRRRDMIRQEVHDELQAAFSLPHIHSEYGMTELLSQAYSPGEGLFTCPPWMKVVLRDEEDPFELRMAWPGQQKPLTGAINVIDLANVYSCSFIATDDAARLYSNGKFEVLGRMDGSDLRGCSLLTA